MIRTLSAVMILALAFLAGPVPGTPPAAAAMPPGAPTAVDGPWFIENVGQFDPAARFQAWGGQQAAWLAEDAIWLSAIGPLARSNVETFQRANVRLSFPGANPHPRIVPFERVDTRVSYFRGSDPAGWRAEVPVWRGVRYVDLYPGVALELAADGQDVAWRLAAQPGADVAQVRLRIEGAEAVSWQDGRLLLDTAAGPLSLAPEADFALPVEFAAPATGLPEMLVVPAADAARAAAASGQAPADTPADLLYSTYLSTQAGDAPCGALAVDVQGRAYVTGNTHYAGFPVKPGAFDTTFNGDEDVFVARLNAAGTGLEYATFLGGTGWDDFLPRCAIVADAQGRAYVAGETDSVDFPTTAGAFDTSFNGGKYGGDGFLARLSAGGSSLEYSTYLGGSADDDIAALAVDSLGRAYAAGGTTSSDFPIGSRDGGADRTYNGGEDGFVVRFNAAGQQLEYASFLGGSQDDRATAIAVDGTWRATVAGKTASANFPTTPGAFDTSFNGGGSDAFVLRLNPAGAIREFSSFLGGVGAEAGEEGRNPALAVDAGNRTYLMLSTTSQNLAVTPGAPGLSLRGSEDCYVARLNAAGSALDYGTYLGGSGVDCHYSAAIAVDTYGRALVAGNTVSASAADFPITADAFDRSFNGGWDDAFVALLSLDGDRVEYATFLGGAGGDTVGRVALDANGNAFIVGYTSSKNFPVRSGAFRTTLSGDGQTDHFITKLRVGKTIPPATATPTATATATITLTPTPTATRTATATATVTATPTPSRTPTATATETATPTATPTETATWTPTASPTATATPTPCLMTIRGYVWFDLDGSGLLDGRELPLPGLTVRLEGPAGGQQAMTSFATGLEYRFEDLPPGNYTVAVTRPAWIRFASTPEQVAVALADCRSEWVSFGIWNGRATWLPLVLR